MFIDLRETVPPPEISKPKAIFVAGQNVGEVEWKPDLKKWHAVIHLSSPNLSHRTLFQGFGKTPELAVLDAVASGRIERDTFTERLAWLEEQLGTVGNATEDMREKSPIEIAQAYCAGEFYAGYPCGTAGCPTCGGASRCPRCGNLTAGRRDGDTEYCTSCGGVLGPAFTPTGKEVPQRTIDQLARELEACRHLLADLIVPGIAEPAVAALKLVKPVPEDES